MRNIFRNVTAFSGTGKSTLIAAVVTECTPVGECALVAAVQNRAIEVRYTYLLSYKSTNTTFAHVPAYSLTLRTTRAIYTSGHQGLDRDGAASRICVHSPSFSVSPRRRSLFRSWSTAKRTVCRPSRTSGRSRRRRIATPRMLRS